MRTGGGKKKGLLALLAASASLIPSLAAKSDRLGSVLSDSVKVFSENGLEIEKEAEIGKRDLDVFPATEYKTEILRKSLYPSQDELDAKAKLVKERMEMKQQMFKERARSRLSSKLQNSVRNVPQTCEGGSVVIDGESFSCKNIDFLSVVSADELHIPRSGFNDNLVALSDIWGYTTPLGREIALVCMANGVDFVDVTDPLDPKFIALLPAVGRSSDWCDLKVYDHYAYIVKDSSANGIQVVDLAVLDGIIDAGSERVVLENAFHYDGHGYAHNVVMDEEQGLLFTVGAQTCGGGGLNVFDLTFDPVNLDNSFAGCIGQDGYVHDAQCLVYNGPHKKFQGQTICIGFDATAITIFKVKKVNAKKKKVKSTILSRTGYTGSGYVHQGWLSNDHKYIIADDEGDEFGGAHSARTYVFDISNLKNPILHATHDSPALSIDHNLYVWGAYHSGSEILNNYAYCSNYAAGLRVLSLDRVEEAQIVEAGYFDVSPEFSGVTFRGTWSNYMFPSSGNIVVSNIERGLFVLKPLMAFEDVQVNFPFLPEEEADDDNNQKEEDSTENEDVKSESNKSGPNSAEKPSAKTTKPDDSKLFKDVGSTEIGIVAGVVVLGLVCMGIAAIFIRRGCQPSDGLDNVDIRNAVRKDQVNLAKPSEDATELTAERKETSESIRVGQFGASAPSTEGFYTASGPPKTRRVRNKTKNPMLPEEIDATPSI